MSKRKAEDEGGDYVEIMPLGAGSEVGRSCIFLSYKGKNILLDCGVHPAFKSLEQLPYFDSVDLSTIDLLLVSHFHLDHAAAIPFLVGKTGFKGRIFMTHPTTAIFKLMLTDFVKVSNISTEDMLFNDQDLEKCMQVIEAVDYHQEFNVNGIKFSALNAGHVLGAAMWSIEIGGVKILYTGDFSRHDDRHLNGAETPSFSPDILIVESTYGIQILGPRREREKRFTDFVSSVVRQGGKCLIPVFALGRAQELLLILDEYWKDHADLQHVPIYYASSLAHQCMNVYQTFPNMMNARIREQISINNPFQFAYIKNLPSIRQFKDQGSSVIMASPGMLQSGMSREIFDRWCTNAENGVIIPGYSVSGTLAKQLMNDPSEVTTLSGLSVPMNMQIAEVSFSAHSDFEQTSEFIDTIRVPNVVLVHGEKTEMARLRNALVQKFKDRNFQVQTPKNTQKVLLKFRPEKIARVIGKMAATGPPINGAPVSGILVKSQADFTHSIMSADELTAYTEFKTNTITQRQLIPFSQTFAALTFFVSQLFSSIRTTIKDSLPCLQVYDSIWIKHDAKAGCLILEWVSNAMNDMVTDALLTCILRIEQNPASVRVLGTREEDAAKSSFDVDAFSQILRAQFGDQVGYDSISSTFTLQVQGRGTVNINWKTSSIECSDLELKKRLQRLLTRVRSTSGCVH